MCSLYKNKDLLKNQPFHSEEIKSAKKNHKEIGNIKLLSELPFFQKEPKKFTIKQLSDALPFQPKRTKRPKTLTKYQILSNILPFFDDVRILRIEHAHSGYTETYNVEVMHNRSLNDSLFLAKRSIKDFFKDLLREKRGFKYNLVVEITLKRWNNAINRYDIETIFIRSGAVTVINQRFNFGALYEILKKYIRYLDWF